MKGVFSGFRKWREKTPTRFNAMPASVKLQVPSTARSPADQKTGVFPAIFLCHRDDFPLPYTGGADMLKVVLVLIYFAGSIPAVAAAEENKESSAYVGSNACGGCQHDDHVVQPAVIVRDLAEEDPEQRAEHAGGMAKRIDEEGFYRV